MNNNRIQYLDALRGIAALIVVLYHVPYFSFLNTGPHLYIPSAHSCVCLFFLLSGFVLSFKYLGESAQTDSLLRAMVKRPIRLFGVVVVVSILGYGLQPKFTLENISTICHLLITDPFNVGTPVIPPLWTIGVEFTGSIVTYVILLALQNKTYVWRLLILLASLLFFRNSFTSAFILGIIVADWFKHNQLKSQTKIFNVVSILLLPVALWLFSFRADENIFSGAYIKSMTSTLGALLIMIIICVNTRIQKVLICQPLLFVGRISFSLYAVHWLFVVTSYDYILGYCQEFGCGNFSAWVTVVTSIILSIGAAWLITRYIDEPCIKQAAKITKIVISPQRNENLIFMEG